MSKASEKLDSADMKSIVEDGMSISGIQKKLNYLSAGLQVKLTRVNAVKRFYIVVFPLFLLTLRELLYGPSDWKFLIIIFLICLACSAIVWGIFFQGDKAELERIDIITQQLIKETQLL